MTSHVLAVILVVFVNPLAVHALVTPQSTLGKSAIRPSSTPLKHSYGRGAEIWPESQDDAVQLSDSFPNGQVPYSAVIAIEKQDMKYFHQGIKASINHDDNPTEEDEEDEPVDVAMVARASSSDDTKLDPKSGAVRRRKRLPARKRKYMRRILRRAAAKEELDTEGELSSVDKAPIFVALSLVLRGFVRPMDVLVVACCTTYLIVLNMAARSSRDLTGAPVMPATPPQGHVPTMVSQPLGRRTNDSVWYQTWLKAGILIGFLGPLALLARSYVTIKLGMGMTPQAAASRICARPLFLLCCQIVTESICRKSLTPLPLRILIPLLYNVIRLAYLWRWATTPAVLGIAGRVFGIANLAYWSINLLAFLIPIASIRYMRAHFYGVEAQEVTTRIGLEETAGLIPNFNSF